MPNSGTPSQRSTRSGSNAQNINLNDIKSLIQTANSELTSIIEKKIDKIYNLLGTTLKRVEELEKRNKQLESDLQRLNAIQTEDGAVTRFLPKDLQEDPLYELEERHKRRKYIIVSGLSECLDGSIEDRKNHDKDLVKNVAKEIGFNDFEPREIIRIGRLNSQRPRLLRLKCKDTETKFSILREARNLRNCSKFKTVYINPDLTRIQRERGKMLRTELKRRQESGESVAIRGGKIVDLQNENFH